MTPSEPRQPDAQVLGRSLFEAGTGDGSDWVAEAGVCKEATVPPKMRLAASVRAGTRAALVARRMVGAAAWCRSDQLWSVVQFMQDASRSPREGFSGKEACRSNISSTVAPVVETTD